MGDTIGDALSELSKYNDNIELPTRIIVEELLSSERLFQPREPKPEPKRVTRRKKKPLLRERAVSQLRREFLDKLKKDPVRVREYLERFISQGDEVVDGDLGIENLDDLIVRLQLRELSRKLPLTHDLAALQQHDVRFASGGGQTANIFLGAPK